MNEPLWNYEKYELLAKRNETLVIQEEKKIDLDDYKIR